MAVTTFTPTAIRAGGQIVTPWVTVYLPAVGGGSQLTYRWADIPIADINTLGGMKDGRILQWGGVRRAIDFRDGQVEQQSIAFSLADVDQVLGAALSSANNRFWLRGWESKVEIIGSAGRTALDDALVLGRGVLRTLQGGRQSWALTFADALDLDELRPLRTLSTAQFADLPTAVAGAVEPIIYGEINDAATTNKGAVPTIYVGTETISSVVWHRFLVAGHACKGILATYSGGTLISAGQYGVDVLAPGYTGWPFGSTVYRDIGTPTRRYTLIYARGPVGDNAANGTATLTVNVQGIEAAADALTGNADGSQTLITDVVKQWRHFLANFLLQDWQSGTWLGNPIWSAAQPTLTKIESASFDTVVTELTTRLAGGYVGAGVVGYDGQKPIREHIAEWCRSCDAGLFVNAAGQLALATVDAKASSATYTEQDDIIGGLSFNYEPDALYNVVPYTYAEAYTANQVTSGAARVSSGSASAFGGRRSLVSRAFRFLRSATVAASAASAVLARHRDPPLRVQFAVPVYGLHREVGQYVSLTHKDGIGSGGWTGRLVQIESMAFDPASKLVHMTAIDRGYTSVGGDSAEAYAAGTGGVSITTGSTSVATVAVLAGDRHLGGALDTGVRVSGVQDVPNAVDITIDWSIFAAYTMTVVVWGFTRNASATWRAELWSVVSNSPSAKVAEDSAAQSNTTRAERSFTLAASTGSVTYRLRVRGVSTAETIYCMGSLRIQP